MGKISNSINHYLSDNRRFADLFNGILFQALQYRKDRAGLQDLMEQDERYRCMDADTLETMSVMLELPSIWKNREKYMEKNEEDKEEYNMCQAIREWAAEERSIGRKEGRQTGLMEGRQVGRQEGWREGMDEKTGTIVRNMLLRGMTNEDIMAIAECDQELIDELRANM